MVNWNNKKKSLDEMVQDIKGGAGSSSLSVSTPKKATINSTSKQNDSSILKNLPGNIGSPLLDAYVQRQKKATFQIPSINNVSPYTVDERTIRKYEAIPNYNVLERALDKSKSQAYEKKQSMQKDYVQAQDRTAKKLMAQNNISEEDLEKAFVKAPSVALFQENGDFLTDAIYKHLINPKQTEAVKKSFQNKGLSEAQTDLLDAYYKRLSIEKTKDNASKFADGHEALGTLVSFPTNFAGDIYSAVGNLGSYLTGSPIDSEGMWNSFGNINDEMRQQASKDLGDVGRFAYNVGTSIGDMAPTIALTAATGGVTAIPALVSGVRAFGDVTREGAERELSPVQNMATGASAATIEAILEKIPLGGLADLSKGTTKSLAKSLVKQGMNEAAEEMGTETLTSIADRIINGDKSHFELNKQNYLAQGMSEEEATKNAFIDSAKNVGYSGLTGFAAGGVTGAGASLIGRGVNSDTISNDTLTTQDEKNILDEEHDGFVPTSYENGNGIDRYDSHTAGNLTSDKGVTSNTKDYAEFVNDSLNDNNHKVTYYFGKISNELADDIYESTGLELDGFNIVSDSDSIRHSKKQHSDEIAEAKKGQIALNSELLSRLPEVYNKPDKIELSDKTDSRGRKIIKFTKRINGIIVVADAISNGRNRLSLDTMYIKNSHSTGLDTNMSQAQRPERSVEKATFDNSIPNSTENVNVTQDAVERIRQLREQQSGNQRVRSYNETLINKTDAPQELKNEFINNPDMYTQLSNADTLEQAINILQNNSIGDAITQYRHLLDNKNPIAVPLGYNISKQLSQSGRLDESVQIVREMSRALTESGQFSQSAAIAMLNNNPEAAKRYLVRELDVMNQKGKEKFGKRWTDFELTESELEQFNAIEEGDTESIKALYEEVYTRLRKQYPSTMTEKLLELRRVSMLLNVRTNVRNVVSNALLFPVRWTADRFSALGEGAYCLINPKYERTQSINPIRSKTARNLASQAFENVKSELLGDNKYEDMKDATRDKQVFKGTALSRGLDTITGGAITKLNAAMGKDVDASVLETARNFTYWLLQKGDDAFVRKNFESRMASYIDAQKITDLESIPADAYTLATQEAFKATFKDDSDFANTLSSFRRLFNKLPGHFIGEAVMPFTKTPANLAMRGIDYSPAGVYNAIKTLKSAKSNADIAKGLTQVGQALTGTAAIALGYVLAEAGILKGALSEDKDEAQFQKQQGELAYSIKTPFGYLTYDWAQPASIPMILGVTIYDSINNEQDFVSGLKKGTLAAVDSWLELSPLQNLADIFGGYGTTSENVAGVIADMPLSFLPAQLGAAAKVNDTTQRVTYDSTDGWKSFINQAKAKIPGMSETLPVAYDTWGNPIRRQDSTGEAAFANLLNPGQFGNENVTAIDDEILALYESTNDKSVFPRKATWDENDTKLNNEQYSEFQRIMGENAYDMASSFINSASYETMDDELKVKAIGEMYSFAHAMAKSEVTEYDIANSQSYKTPYSVFQEKGAEGVATYYAITANKDGQSNVSLVNAVNALDISNEDRGYYIAVMKGELSKEATEAYNSGGYEAVYALYSQKTAAERIKQLREQAAVERIKALREQSNTTVTPEMVERIRQLRNTN